MADRLIFWGPSVVTVIYVLTAIGFTQKRQYAFALTYFAYALANIGLIWAASKH